MEVSKIPCELIYDISNIAVQLLYSNTIGIPVLIGAENFMFSGQPISLVAKSNYFKSLFSQLDFRVQPVSLFSCEPIGPNLKAFTALWNYLNGAEEVPQIFEHLNYIELINL